MIKKIILALLLMFGVFGEIHAEEDSSEEAPSLVKVGESIKSVNLNELLTTDLERNSEGASTDGVGVRQSEGIGDLFDRAIGFMVLVVPALAVLILIIGAYFIMTSNGNDNTLSQGKDIIKYTLIGVTFFFGSYIIVKLILSFLTASIT